MSKNKVGDDIQRAGDEFLGKRVQIIGCKPCNQWLRLVSSIHDLRRKRAEQAGRCVCEDIGRRVTIGRYQSVPGSQTLPISGEFIRVLPEEVELVPRREPLIRPAFARITRIFRSLVFSRRQPTISPQAGE